MAFKCCWIICERKIQNRRSTSNVLHGCDWTCDLYGGIFNFGMDLGARTATQNQGRLSVRDFSGSAPPLNAYTNLNRCNVLQTRMLCHTRVCLYFKQFLRWLTCSSSCYLVALLKQFGSIAYNNSKTTATFYLWNYYKTNLFNPWLHYQLSL